MRETVRDAANRNSGRTFLSIFAETMIALCAVSAVGTKKDLPDWLHAQPGTGTDLEKACGSPGG